VFGDVYTRFATGHGLGRPRCPLDPPPVEGYWTSRLRELQARVGDRGPTVPAEAGADVGDCQHVFAKCYR
jgi:hypothetical protein